MSAPAAAAATDLDDLYGGMDEDGPAVAAPAAGPPAPTAAAAAAPAAPPAAAATAPPPPARKRATPAERAAEAAADAERAAYARLAPAAPLAAAREIAVIREGEYAIFDVNGEKLSILQVRASATVRIGRACVSMAPILGAPFGSVFRLQNRAAGGHARPYLVRVPRHASVMGGEGWAAQAAEEAAADDDDDDAGAELRAAEEAAAAAAAAAEPDGNGNGNAADASAAATLSVALETRNNARLFDLGTRNQALTAGDVLELKRKAREGGEVIAALCAASATFQQKTAFAQAKYKRRKAKKHAAELCVRRPTGRAVAQAMFDARGPGRMMSLRPDSVAIALSMANVGAHARVLVFEATSMAGVLAAAAAERLGGHGLVCAASFFPEQRGGPLDAVRHMNFTPEERAAVCSATLEDLRAAKRAVDEEEEEGEQGGAAAAGERDAAIAADGQAPPVPRGAAKSDRLRALVRAGFTGAILADPRADTLDLIDAAFPLLQPSTPFCIYHQCAQPLAEAQSALASARSAVMMRLGESWTRPYQVLPGRTHPHMACNGTGGYLLSGVTASADGVVGAGVVGF